MKFKNKKKLIHTGFQETICIQKNNPPQEKTVKVVTEIKFDKKKGKPSKLVGYVNCF